MSAVVEQLDHSEMHNELSITAALRGDAAETQRQMRLRLASTDDDGRPVEHGCTPQAGAR